MTSRRTVLKALGAALAAGMTGVPGRVFSLQEKQMSTRSIPRTGEQIPVIGLGTWQTFDVADAAAREPLREVLDAHFAAGGRVIDSSPMYGHAEEAVGALLTPDDAPFLATKVWTSGRDAGIRQIEASFQKLRVERIDLMQIHNLVDWRTHLPTLRGWRDDGRIRYLGVTHYQHDAFADLEAIIRNENVDFVQLPYSLTDRAAEARLLPAAAEHGVAVLVMQPFATGGLFRRVRGRPLPGWAAEFDCASWAQFFLKFILGHPAVTCPLPATSDPAHARDNVKAGQGRLPDEALRRRMAAEIAA
jgi:aryl-alcohol dehydrogenase-like predicted oxidoreductase